jgi:hypothetical protein
MQGRKGDMAAHNRAVNLFMFSVCCLLAFTVENRLLRFC